MLLPVIFTALGAGLAFLLGRWRDSLDARAAKKAFFAAIRMELLSMRDQIDASSDTIKTSMLRFRDHGIPPQMTGTLRTAVFSSQLNKLKDLADPLLMEIVKFYSDIPVLEQTRQTLNDCSRGYLDGSNTRQGLLFERITSVCQTLVEQLSSFRTQIEALEHKLAPAGKRQPAGGL